jgi:hypothetical protein
MKIKEVVRKYMEAVPEVKEYCDRCLATKRWQGSVVLMLVDAAFTSIGLNYFLTVVPRVEEFRRVFVDRGTVTCLEDLAVVEEEPLRRIWRNRRSWRVAKGAASYLAGLKKEEGLGDREALRFWARNARVEEWRKDPIGRIRGVGINTFQYLRMMGGVDTVMPDKVVRRVIKQILEEAGEKVALGDDLEFIKLVHGMAARTGYRAIELCWMTWLIQSEGGVARSEKYSKVLPLI